MSVSVCGGGVREERDGREGGGDIRVFVYVCIAAPRREGGGGWG